jgi:hypothetical protein
VQKCTTKPALRFAQDAQASAEHWSGSHNHTFPPDMDNGRHGSAEACIGAELAHGAPRDARPNSFAVSNDRVSCDFRPPDLIVAPAGSKHGKQKETRVSILGS